MTAMRKPVPGTPMGIGAGPAFMTDPRRGCAPGKADPDLFYADTSPARRRAVRICRRECPFTAECDQWATEHREMWGVWGGRNRNKKQERRDRLTTGP